MKQIEAQAADALLDRRLKINLPAPWPLRIFGRKTIPIWVKRPVASNLFRMSRLFVRMGNDPEKVKTESFGTVLEYIGQHGVTASRIIAYGLIRGSFSAWLLNRPLAWYIRSHSTLPNLAELVKIITVLSGAEAFVSIIRSVSQLKMTDPTLSQTETGS